MIKKQNRNFSTYFIDDDDDDEYQDYENNPPSYEYLQLQQDKLILRQNKSERILTQLKYCFLSIQQKEERQKGGDALLKKLKKLKDDALDLQFISIAELIQISIGKRIWILQCQRRRKVKEHLNKFYQHVELRYQKIENYKYTEAQINKIKEKTFLFKPNSNGIGFNFQSCDYRELYKITFKTLETKQIIRQINKIWYSVYDIYYQQILRKTQKIFIYIVEVFSFYLVVFAFFEIWGLLDQYKSFKQMNLMIISFIVPTIIFLLVLMGMIDFNKPTGQQYELVVIKKRIQQYLHSKNIQESKKPHGQIRGYWKIQEQLLYIELYCHGKLSEDKTMKLDPIFTICTQKLMNQYTIL